MNLQSQTGLFERKSSTPTTTATLNQALKDLIEKATTEQQHLQNQIVKSWKQAAGTIEPKYFLVG